MRESELKSATYNVCKNCLMDTTAANIEFNSEGICNFCREFEKRNENLKLQNNNLEELVNKIKKDGKNKKYDCIVGVSGGVDSSFSLLKANNLYWFQIL